MVFKHQSIRGDICHFMHAIHLQRQLTPRVSKQTALLLHKTKKVFKTVFKMGKKDKSKKKGKGAEKTAEKTEKKMKQKLKKATGEVRSSLKVKCSVFKTWSILKGWHWRHCQGHRGWREKEARGQGDSNPATFTQSQPFHVGASGESGAHVFRWRVLQWPEGDDGWMTILKNCKWKLTPFV